LYFVINGKGKFTIEKEVVSVEMNDVIIIPKNTPYDFQGNMRLLLVNSPAFDRKADKRLE